MIRKLFAYGVFALCLGVSNVSVHANILITPTQVVFDDRERFADVTLANTSDKSQSYELSWVLFNMTEGKGTYSAVEVKPKFDMSEFIRFTPRRVTLPPSAKQKVRLRFSRPADIPNGDYHVHLKFKAVPSDISPMDQPVEKSLVQVPINISYTIPVVVRIGEAQSQVSLGQIALDRDQNTGQLQMDLPVERGDGVYSVLGYIRVYHDAGDGNEILVGEISNANLFPEISKRVFSVPLKTEITGGSLRVEVRHSNKENDFVYAEKVYGIQ